MSEKLDPEVLEGAAGGASYSRKGNIVIINCQHACNIRSRASGNSEIIGHAYAGKTYSYYGWEGNWCRIHFNNGRVGYVYTDFVLVIK